MKFYSKPLVICLAVVAFLSNVPCLIATVKLLHDWYQLKTQHIVYFEYAYVISALVWCVVALFGISPLLHSLLHRTRYIAASLLAIAVGLITTTLLSDYEPGVKLELRAARLLAQADESLAHWDDVHGRFPKDEKELLDALSVRPLSEAPIFRIDGRDLSYSIRLVSKATKPYDGPLPGEPGAFIYAVRDNSQEYWLTMTTLADPVGGPVAFQTVPGSDHRLWTMHRTHRSDGKAQSGFKE
jgi:hypothetical protein